MMFLAHIAATSSPTYLASHEVGEMIQTDLSTSTVTAQKRVVFKRFVGFKHIALLSIWSVKI